MKNLQELVASIPANKEDPNFWLVLCDAYEEEGFDRSEAGRLWLTAHSRKPYEDTATQLRGIERSYDWRSAEYRKVTSEFPSFLESSILPFALFQLIQALYTQEARYFIEFPTREEAISVASSQVPIYLVSLVKASPPQKVRGKGGNRW